MDKKFSIYIIESPSLKDSLFSHMESDFLVKFLKKFRFDFEMKVIKDSRSFKKDLSINFENFYYEKRVNPVLHLSMHGCREGIAFFNGSLIGWRELADILEPLNSFSDKKLVLYLSVCRGIFAQEMVTKDNYPFKYIICNHGPIDLKEAVIGSCIFYHHLNLGTNIECITKIMNTSTGNGYFEILQLEKVKKRLMVLDKFRKTMAQKKPGLHQIVQNSPG
jgi:hypothetical protein